MKIKTEIYAFMKIWLTFVQIGGCHLKNTNLRLQFTCLFPSLGPSLSCQLFLSNFERNLPELLLSFCQLFAVFSSFSLLKLLLNYFNTYLLVLYLLILIFFLFKKPFYFIFECSHSVSQWTSLVVCAVQWHSESRCFCFDFDKSFLHADVWNISKKRKKNIWRKFCTK